MFNALRYTKILENVGFTKDQASTTLKVLMEVMDQNFATNERLGRTELIMKTDLEKVEFRLSLKIQNVEDSLRSEMEKLETGLRSDMEKLETGLRSDMEKMALRSDLEKVENAIIKRFNDFDIKLLSMENRLFVKLFGTTVAVVGLLKLIS